MATTSHDAGDAGGLESLLAGYAAGALPPPLHALVEAHLEMRPENRVFVRDLESAAAGLVEASAPAALPRRDDMLAAIFDATAQPLGAAPEPRPDWPHALARYAAAPDKLAWRRLLPGVRHCEVGVGDVDAAFIWIKPGRAMPSHTHGGDEVTLVLRGGFTESGRHYGVGALAIANESVDHKPVADLDGDCVCFAVTTAPLKLTGPVGRLLEKLRSR